MKKDKMTGTVMDRLASLTDRQVVLLLRLMDSPGRAGFVTEPERTLIGGLRKKELIEPFGRVGLKQRYRIPDNLFGGDERKFLKELGGIING